MTKHRGLAQYGGWLAVGIPFVALVVIGYALFPRAPFSGDAGVKLAQANDLWDSRFSTRRLDHDRAIDPTGTFVPFGEGFVHKDGDDFKAAYSVVFGATAAVPIGLFGDHGVPIIPLGGSLLISIAVFLFLRRFDLHPGWIACVIALTLFVTPFLLYSFELAEHTIAGGLVTMAFVVAMQHAERRRAVLWAGVLVALAAVVRPEGYLCVAAFGVGIAALPVAGVRAWLERAGLFVAGALVVLLVYWGLNLVTAGMWEPMFGADRIRDATVQSSIVTMLITELPKVKLWTWLVPFAVVLAVGIAAPHRFSARWRILLTIAATVVVAVFAYRAQSLTKARTISGLVAVTPLACLGLVRGPWASMTRCVWVTSVVFIVLAVVLEPTGAAGGLQLGSRYLLLVIPALVCLAVISVVEVVRATGNRVWQAAVLLPALALVVLQAKAMYGERGIPKCLELQRKGARAIATVRASKSDVVITSRYWESRVLAQTKFDGKSLFTAQGDLGVALVEALAAKGVTQFLYTGGENLAIPLQDGRTARTRLVHKGFIVAQEVLIE